MNSKTLAVPGKLIPTKHDFFISQGKVEVAAIRDGEKPRKLAPVMLPETDDLMQRVFGNFEDIVSVDLEDGSHEWLTVEELSKRTVRSRSGESDDSDVVQVGTMLDSVTTRGGGMGIKFLERLGFSDNLKAQVIKRLKEAFKKKYKSDFKAELKDAAKEVLGAAAARLICEIVEFSLVPTEGLFELSLDNPQTWITDDAKPCKTPSPGKEPMLLLIHGTASSTDGAFAGLAEQERIERWRELAGHKDYAGLWAFNHKTLTRSPLYNVNMLLTSLPVGAKLHVVSHSRGGLVGELLCVEPNSITEQDRELFETLGGKFDLPLFYDKSEFETYTKLLRKKRPKVERFVRVACPALGTTLASGRLEKYISGFSNAIRYALKGAAVGLTMGMSFPAAAFALKLERTVEVLDTCATALSSQKGDPSVLPGLAAMMPTSPLVKFLNRRSRESKADLTVIAADVKSKGSAGFFAEIRNKIGDLFYLEEHDLVVPTRSMYGGIPRQRGARFYLSEGAQAHHLRYFRNEDTFHALLTGLRGESFKYKPIESDQLDDKSWFESLKFAFRDEESHDNRPVVFLLPGIMGSELSVNGNRLWLDIGELTLQSGFVKRLAINTKNVKATGVLSDYYRDLAVHLSKSHRVIVFPFDWRKSIADSGEKLADSVASVARSTTAPVRFIAHSMGGLVVRSMMTHSAWSEVKDRKGCRIVMLGTPNHGSYSALKALLGKGGLLSSIDLLALGDPQHNRTTILKTLHNFPGLLELMPPTETLEHRWNLIFKRNSEVIGISKPQLSKARKFWKSIEDAVDPNTMVYVAGRGRHTPESYDAKESGRVEIITTTQGDGTVPWKRGKLEGVPTYHTRVDHGSLPKNKSAFDGYTDLLIEGRTSHREVVFKEEPRFWFRDGLSQPMPKDSPLLFPTRETLEATIMGVQSFGKAVAQPYSKVNVRVVHADLRYSEYPVMLGHYEQAPLESTEHALDSLLNGKLSKERALRLYPGPVGTFRYFSHEQKDKGSQNSGFVIGLGKYGHVTTSQLTYSVRQAVLHYCLQQEPAGDTVGKLGLSVVAIASMEGGVGLKDSIESILVGVQQANRALSGQNGNLQLLTHLEILELYDGRAIQATHHLNRLCSDARLAKDFKAEPRLQSVVGGGGRTQMGGDGDLTGWQRMDIANQPVDEDTSKLTYKILDNSARSQEIKLELEDRFINLYLQRTSANPRWDQELSQTLFELLIPTSLKEFADDGRHLLLLLNNYSARFPWELLVDGMSEEREPLSVKAKMVRQLTTPNDRDRPLNSLSKSALIVGDPPSELRALPGAQREATKVASALAAQGFEAECLIQPAGEVVVSKLLSKPYRIIHLSGHGIYQLREGKKPRSGMVLGGGLLLTPAILAQLRTCPELVFINCCHLGKIDQTEAHFPSLAANIATEMIEAGAKAVVAAGWAVEDQCAELFGLTFYRTMLAGESFGEAVLRARQAVYNAFPQFNTWGAYQAYGDPEYSLNPNKRRSGNSTDWNYVAPGEVVADLKNLCEKAKVSFLKDFEKLPTEMAAIVHRIPGEWKGEPDFNADVVVELGRTYSQLVHPLFGTEGREKDEALSAALAYYEVAEKSSSLTIDDISIKLRLELLLLVHSRKPDFNAMMSIIEKRQTLVPFSDNSKSNSRVGGAAMTALTVSPLSRTRVNQLLKIMLENYREAFRDEPQDSYFQDYYHLPILCKEWSLPDGALLDLPVQGDNFFAVWAGARRRLLRWLGNGSPAQGYQDVKEGFQKSWHRGASPFQFKAILELMDFLVAMRFHFIDEQAKKKKRKTKTKRETPPKDRIYLNLIDLRDVVIGAVTGE